MTMLAQAAELQVGNSQKPELDPQQGLFSDTDSFLRELSPNSDREHSVIRETVPPLPIRPSLKHKKLANIGQETVGISRTIEEDDVQRSEEELPEFHFLSVAYIGKDKSPCYSKLIDNIGDF